MITKVDKDLARNVRVQEIDDHLERLARRRDQLRAERRQLVKPTSPYSGDAKIWANSILKIVEQYPGVSRKDIVGELNSPIPSQVLTNMLTLLRRRGSIENQGTKKHPKWYIKEDS